jgi:hypothetical protein
MAVATRPDDSIPNGVDSTFRAASPPERSSTPTPIASFSLAAFGNWVKAMTFTTY